MDVIQSFQFNADGDPILVSRHGQLRFLPNGNMRLAGSPQAFNGWGHTLVGLPGYERLALFLEYDSQGPVLCFELTNGRPLRSVFALAELPPTPLAQPEFTAWLERANAHLRGDCAPEQSIAWP